MYFKYYESIHHQRGTKISFEQFIDLIKNPTISVLYTIQKIRSEEDKKQRNMFKKQLPLVTPSVIPSAGRKSEIVKYSNVICFDFDHTPGLNRIKHRLEKIPYVLCYFTSPSGDGLKVFVQTKFCNKQEFEIQWEQISDDLAYKISELPDTSRSDINGTCFLSFDENIYVNPSPGLFQPNEDTGFEWVDSFQYRYNEDQTELYNRVSQVVDKSISSGIDLTTEYQQWRNIGFAIADAFDKDGEVLFQRISSLHPEYNMEDTTELYTECCRDYDNENRITIATLFYYAKEHGITISQNQNKNEKLI
ncbi:MAG: BT4734/BF3469 family protein [Bacteroidales bacterium]|jgi:hypothetical protein|nr:BT4734/BF3469 family protein [Bacteroidales bacterium]